ncbi:hypothetical protein [Amycolatopsis eburnea]|uniref:Uncharacterized protein n=1 Tax=Amycolatopsis eburnea TaxID=2267691 RepID=A0A427TQ58_9PSEU|nr:hypothetical protein [Amycolatopsis eburnea]RSD26436.1 hypothetical protein EIY87_00170 [Amycolatopsis eburnea]
MGRRLQQLREEWAAAGEALERNDRARSRRRSEPTAAAAGPECTAADVTVMNTATIAGVVANFVVNS